jgi:hypothetical protein
VYVIAGLLLALSLATEDASIVAALGGSFGDFGDVVQYGDTYRLCYIRGPEGILIGLAEELGART